MKSFGVRLIWTALLTLCGILSHVAFADEQDDPMLKACPALREWQDQQKQKHGKEKLAPASSMVLPKLREQLLTWSKLDQKAREPMMKGSAIGQAEFKIALARMRSVDALNYRRIRGVIDEYGFPTITMVGGDGSAAAFLLVQHQAEHPEFQQFVLDIMGPLAKRGEVGREGYALLLDRVLVMGQHKPQRYGTQFTQAGGTMQMEPVEDAEHLDERRADMDMMPIAAYRCVLAQMYFTPVK